MQCSLDFSGSTTSKARPMCRRRRKRVRQKSVRLNLDNEEEEGDEGNEELEFDEEEGDEPELIAAGVSEVVDQLMHSDYYNDEFCGEGDEDEASCFKLQGKADEDETDATGGDVAGDDDDWDYYYVPCDPAIDGEEEGMYICTCSFHN